MLDSDVLFAGAASPGEHGASLTILRLAEIALLDAVTPRQVIAEADRNLAAKLPAALPAFWLLVTRCLREVDDPRPENLPARAGRASPTDLPILVTAVREKCPWLVTFNVRHYQPGHPQVTVLRPGEFVGRIREILVGM